MGPSYYNSDRSIGMSPKSKKVVAQLDIYGTLGKTALRNHPYYRTKCRFSSLSVVFSRGMGQANSTYLLPSNSEISFEVCSA